MAIALLISPPAFCATRSPIIHGICMRPFPAIFQLDYPYCRAKAWLAALQMGADRLPDTVTRHLMELDLEPALGKMAIASRFYPLDVVTPETANSRDIRVFLKDSEDLSSEQIFRNPLDLLLRMSIIAETAQTVREISSQWPETVEAAREKMPWLSTSAAHLNALWAGTEPENENSPSIALLLAAASANPGTHSSMKYANAAFKIALASETSQPKHHTLWNLLAVHALYLRGLGHEKNGESALAELDYNTALARLQKSSSFNTLKADITLSRGILRQSLGNIPGMCEDFNTACTLGHCQGLAEARREGQCLPPSEEAHALPL